MKSRCHGIRTSWAWGKAIRGTDSVYGFVTIVCIVASGCSSEDPVFTRDVDQALADAVEQGDLEGIDSAIAEGADINAVGERGYTPLFLAYYEYRNKASFKYLLELGADPHLTTDNGECVVNWVARDRDDSDWLRITLEHGGDPNVRWQREDGFGALGSTPMWDAVLSNNTTNLDLMVAYGGEVNVVDDDVKADSPAIFASASRQPVMAQWLLEHGADWTIQNTEGVSVAEAELAQRYDATEFSEDAAAHEWILNFLEEQGVDMVAAEARSREIYGQNFRR